ncbi:MAG: hypothetical protein M2R45_03783 [Verrucomicrobia subdivision 3 bacterium]|nr:hypothetical protein [Limisphaerales bacterium]MCS1416776.1 hypothetical protein [Limisphaerales bacterium]
MQSEISGQSSMAASKVLKKSATCRPQSAVVLMPLHKSRTGVLPLPWMNSMFFSYGLII